MTWDYNPDLDATGIPLASGIGITFNQKLKAGSGNITLRTGGYDGTVVENFGIGSSVTISGNDLSITPTSDLTKGAAHYVTLPSGVITNMAGDSYVGTAYSFTAIGQLNSLWSWGYNTRGETGHNTGYGDFRSSPTQIPGTNWLTGSKKNSTAVIKTDGTLWTWGEADYGQLALNDTAHRSSPVQVGSDTNWSNVSVSTFAMHGVKTDGTLWAWGGNGNGWLGQNDRTQRSSPIQIGSGTDWSETFGGSQGAMGAVKTDGTLWTWGKNTHGQLGHSQATPVQLSSPTQIPGTTWKQLACNDNK